MKVGQRADGAGLLGPHVGRGHQHLLIELEDLAILVRRHAFGARRPQHIKRHLLMNHLLAPRALDLAEDEPQEIADALPKRLRLAKRLASVAR